MRKTRQKRPTEPEYIAERLAELAAKGFLRVVGYRRSERTGELQPAYTITIAGCEYFSIEAPPWLKN
jgi:hypothetical protein